MTSSYQKTTRWTYHSTGTEIVQAFPENVKDKTILITGPSEGGIGASTALALASGSPSQLLLLGRSPSKINPVIQDLAVKYPSVSVKFVKCDLSSQSSIRSASQEIKTILGEKGLDILICNAAIMACPFGLTEDGVESQFGTNHLGHFLLVNLLKENVLKAENPRVVMVSSSAHRGARIRFEDWNFDGEGKKGEGMGYDAWEAYGQSKLGNILFAKSLARMFERRGQGKAFSVHPGSIRSGLQVHMLASDTLLAEGIAKATAAEAKEGRVFKRDAPKTLEQGCATTLVAVLDPGIQSASGAYLVNGDIAEYPPPKDSVGVEGQDRLWELSEKLVGEKFSW